MRTKLKEEMIVDVLRLLLPDYKAIDSITETRDTFDTFIEGDETPLLQIPTFKIIIEGHIL